MGGVSWCLVLGVLTHSLTAAPASQNPVEAMGVAALGVFSAFAEVVQNGGAVKKEMGFGNEFFGVHTKTAVGMGNAIQPPVADDSDEDSSEERRKRSLEVSDDSDDSDDSDEDSSEERRKRSLEVSDDETMKMPFALSAIEDRPHPHVHRGKRSPCGTGTGTVTQSPVDETEAVRRRRAQRLRAAARKKKSTTTGKNGKSKTKKVVEDSIRRRRQADVNELEQEAQNVTGHVTRFTEGMRNVWESFVDGIKGIMKQVKQTVSGGQNAANAE